MRWQCFTKSENETVALGKCLGKCLQKKDIIILTGSLGAGKTKFVQGLAQGLSVKKCEYVASPSFVIVKEYTSGRFPLYHMDLYRVDNVSELLSTGFGEYIDSDGVCAIEWGSKIEDFLADDFLRVDITIKSKVSRVVSFYSLKEKYDRSIRFLEERF